MKCLVSTWHDRTPRFAALVRHDVLVRRGFLQGDQEGFVGGLLWLSENPINGKRGGLLTSVYQIPWVSLLGAYPSLRAKRRVLQSYEFAVFAGRVT